MKRMILFTIFFYFAAGNLLPLTLSEQQFWVNKEYVTPFIAVGVTTEIVCAFCLSILFYAHEPIE